MWGGAMPPTAESEYDKPNTQKTSGGVGLFLQVPHLSSPLTSSHPALHQSLFFQLSGISHPHLSSAPDYCCPAGERAMKLLDAGEVLPSEMVLSLVATKLASRECQKSGWVLEGVGTAAAGVDELEEAIVMATEVLVVA